MTKRTALLVLLACATLSAQTPDPSTLPRLGQVDISYLGGFQLPQTDSNGIWFSFGGQAIAHNPAKNSLFVTSQLGALAEVSIPVPVNSEKVADLPMSTYLQPFVDPMEGHLSDVATSGVDVSGLLVSGDRLYGTARIYYDANNTQRVSHYARSTNLSTSSFSGWSQVWNVGAAGFVSGYLANVPAEWQSRLGGPQLTGQCCIPIVSRTSAGPAALSFDASKIGQPTVSAIPLLHYGYGHATLGPWEGSNPTYGAATLMGGMAVIAGTRTVLFVGSNGLGPHCYGDATADKAVADASGGHLCWDPTTSDKGSHAYPYRYQVWAYDLNDFAAVKAGEKQPWEITPYGVWPLNFPMDSLVIVGGVTYDAQRQLLYVTQKKAAPGSVPVIHVFKLNASGAVTPPPITDPPPPPPPVDPPPVPPTQDVLIAELRAQIAVLQGQVGLMRLTDERDAAVAAKASETARIEAMKALIQQAMKQTTAKAALATLSEALKK